VLEIAGLAVSGVNLALNLFKTARDAQAWQEKDIQVDDEWLKLAIEAGVLPAPECGYEWLNEHHVPSAELRGRCSPVIAHNDVQRIRYRLFLGQPASIGGRLMLVMTIRP
jgi:hypothetical protein